MSKRSIFVQQNSIVPHFAGKDNWAIMSSTESRIKSIIESVGTPLREWNIRINRGILTGYNEAFIVSTEIKDRLIAEDPHSAELIRPILRGRDIRRYGYNWANLWLISTFPSRQYNIDDFPAIKKYLLSFGMERLEQTGRKYTIDGHEIKARKKTNNKWFETQDSIGYWDDFSKPKICWIELTDESKFSYSDDGIYLLNTVFFMVGDHIKYLLAVLNSKLIHWYFLSCTGTTSGVGTNRWLKYTVETIPIPRISTHDELEINALVDTLLSHKQNGKDTTSLEREIDRLVLHAYNLTEEEQSYIMNVD